MRDSYHHGDLHAALLAAGREQLATDGLEKLSLRAVARAAGVSPAAPYRHFKDKHHLLVAIATEGFLILAEMMREATRRQSHDLDAVGQAYLAFAQRNPEVYRLMFTRPMHHETQASDPALLEASAKTFGVLEDVIAHGIAAGHIGPADPGQIALAAWSLVHGSAMFHIDGILAGSPWEEIAPPNLLAGCQRILRHGWVPAV